MRLFFVSILITIPLFSKVKLNDHQLKTLNTVRDIALKYTDKRGESFPNTIAAICMTESSGGINNLGDLDKKNGKYYSSLGAMQIRVPTARYISSLYPKKLKSIHAITDRQLRIKLVSDLKLSAKIASLYIVHLSNTRKNYFQTISGYNGGLKNRKYYNRVMKWNKILKDLGINK
ncbi:MAG: transglycosylase SLT domain-containing protein [Campylobacterota bacterium]|nr:transglycosylase SLT domain-containing protein [Campylobacterota bacterium]